MMSQPLVVAQSGAMPVAPKDAFDAVFRMDVPTVFRHWYGPFPPIKAVTGDWGSVGNARTLMLVGGASMREELVRADAPNSAHSKPIEQNSGWKLQRRICPTVCAKQIPKGDGANAKSIVERLLRN